MTVARRTFKAEIMISLSKNGTAPFRDNEIEDAVLQAEQSINASGLPAITEGKKKIQTYVRLHVHGEIKELRIGEVENGNDKDKDLA